VNPGADRTVLAAVMHVPEAALRAMLAETDKLWQGCAACGVSGPRAEGQLSGNGLLTAVALELIAGIGAAALQARRVGRLGGARTGISRLVPGTGRAGDRPF